MTRSALSGRVDMTHGGGGRATTELVSQIFQRHFSNPVLDHGDDAGVVNLSGTRLAMSTDGHVVSPLFFPGGDIGALSVHGTINDLAMMGAHPLYLTAGFIIEEGFPLADLDRIVAAALTDPSAGGNPRALTAENTRALLQSCLSSG